MEQFKFPKFIELNTLFRIKGGKEDGKWVESKISINPLGVGYFYPVTEDFGECVKDVTCIYISGGAFYVDMHYAEFSEFWAEVKRNFELDEPLF